MDLSLNCFRMCASSFSTRFCSSSLDVALRMSEMKIVSPRMEDMAEALSGEQGETTADWRQLTRETAARRVTAQQVVAAHS